MECATGTPTVDALTPAKLIKKKSEMADTTGDTTTIDSSLSPPNENATIISPKESCTESTTEGPVADQAKGVCGYTPSQGYIDTAGTNSLFDEGFAVMPPPLNPVIKPSYVLMPIDDVPSEANILDHDIKLLHEAHHSDPFLVLGCKNVESQKYGDIIVIRAWIKDSVRITVAPLPMTKFTLTPENKAVEMYKRCDWLYQKCFLVKDISTGLDVKIDDISSELLYAYDVTYMDNNTFTVRDVYSFGLVANDFDLNLFQSGSCWHVDNLMGSHLVNFEGCEGCRFVVWAPNAAFVSVVGDWNNWDARTHPMRKRLQFGCWELFIPSLKAGNKYGYRIHSNKGQNFIKIDPYAQEFENPPAHASVISPCDDAFKKPEDRFIWTDQKWMAHRAQLGIDDAVRRRPMSIYEVHLPSWMRGDGNSYLGYRELADRLVNHVKALNFTHIEFLPLAHHPFEGSWGYQVSGLYAPYSRLGNADDLKYLINKLHENDIGVFVDFVPAHFVKDDWGLVYFDGEPCYEYADPREGEHLEWGTMVFNYRRNEVRSFLLGAAYHWLRRYHIDGLRIDAVSSMLYKNHMRKAGCWIANEFGGDANLQAITLLQELNWVSHKLFSGVFTSAEESTSWKGVSDKHKGLGFDAKWDLGWMNDTLAYLCMPTFMRHQKHNKLTFRGLYMSHEKWVLPLSHDEVVSGKGSLLDKCGFKGASFEERIKTLRTLFGFQVGMPGRPLIFMGCEFGQGREWDESRSVDWHESSEHGRNKQITWLSDLLGVYRYNKALHAGDDEPWNFQWVECDNATDCIIGWIRHYMEWDNDILVLCNFSGQNYYRYPVGCGHGGQWEVLLNSDDWRYNGGMHGPGNLTRVDATQGGRLGWPYSLWIDIPAFGCLYLKPVNPKKCQQEAVGNVTEVTQ